MRLYIKHARCGDYVYFMESYRDPVSKQSRNRIVRSFGRLDDLLKADPGALLKLEAELKDINAVPVRGVDELLAEFVKKEPAKVSFAGMPVLNYGIFCYRALWDELRLDDVLRRISDSAGSSVHLPRTAFLLAALRNMEPCSKAATFRRRGDYLYGFSDVRECDMYKSLDLLADYKERLESHLFKRLFHGRDEEVSVAFYDVTTYYFESVAADGFKGFGFSKDHRVNEVQVVMGLLIDGDGIPLGYDLYPGNTSEFKTLASALKKLKSSYKIKKVIVVADRGLNSKSNLSMIKKLGFEYILAFKVRSAPSDVKGAILSDEGYCSVAGEDGELSYRYKAMPHIQVITEDKKKVVLSDSLVISYSARRAEKDRRDRERLVKKAVKLVGNPAQFKAELKKGGKSFVVADIGGGTLRLDEEKIASQSIFDGYYGIISSDINLPAEAVTAIHHRLWKIEESFRVMKTDLEVRPCFVWTPRRIQGHFVSCYLAFVLQRLLELKLKRGGIQAGTQMIHEAIREANVTAITVQSKTIYIKNETGELYEQISGMLGMEPLHTYSMRVELEKALHHKIIR